jgi:hypothetical protein
VDAAFNIVKTADGPWIHLVPGIIEAQEDVGGRYRLKELEKEVAALDAQWAAIQAECEEAPGLPTDGLLPDLERAIRSAAQEDSTQKLKDLLACLLDEIVVESRARITPYCSLPTV